MESKKPMKCILSICNISPVKLGSFEEFIISLTEKLKEKGFRHVVVFRAEPIKIVRDLLIRSGAEIKVYNPSKSSISNFIPFYRIIKEVNPNIVNFHYYSTYTLVNYLSFLCDVKILYTDRMGFESANTQFKKILRKIFYFTSAKLYGRGIDRIICVSNFVKLKYKKEYGIDSTKMCVIYNGINTTRFKKTLDIEKIKQKYNTQNKFVITTVGLRKEKGPHFLIKAAPSILEKIPNVMFLIVGEGGYESYLRELVIKLNLEDKVTFTGNLTDISPIYDISNCVVIPSLCEEGFCFVLAEAMSKETMVVAFDSGAIKEVVYDRGQVLPKDIEYLSNRLIQILLNDNKFEEEKMRAHVLKNFTLDICTSNYLLLYECLLER